MEPGTSGRAADALNRRVISPAWCTDFHCCILHIINFPSQGEVEKNVKFWVMIRVKAGSRLCQKMGFRISNQPS